MIDLIYGAALGEGAAWPDLGSQLCSMFRAQRVSLSIPDAPGVLRYLLGGGNEYADAYAAYYHRIDPFRQRAERIFHGLNRATLHAVIGEQIVPDDVLLKSEFYVDFARGEAFATCLAACWAFARPRRSAFSAMPARAHSMKAIDIC
ncbi:hypothetical protein CA603_37110 [Paraburkholderia hospita]|nr:hypothetical protein CA603_37110 [Paraburkholderia hospita]